MSPEAVVDLNDNESSANDDARLGLPSAMLH